MVAFVTTVHIFICLFLIIIILLQAGKGAEIGAVFGGSSQTIFGSRGAATFLSKLTAFCAIGFMVTSITLVYISSKSSTSSIMDPGTTQSETGKADSSASAGEGKAEAAKAATANGAKTDGAASKASQDSSKKSEPSGEADTPPSSNPKK